MRQTGRAQQRERMRKSGRLQSSRKARRDLFTTLWLKERPDSSGLIGVGHVSFFKERATRYLTREENDGTLWGKMGKKKTGAIGARQRRKTDSLQDQNLGLVEKALPQGHLILSSSNENSKRKKTTKELNR